MEVTNLTIKATEYFRDASERIKLLPLVNGFDFVVLVINPSEERVVELQIIGLLRKATVQELHDANILSVLKM